MKEKPVMLSQMNQEMGSGIRAFTMMTTENQIAYLKLYNAYDCDSTDWSSRMRIDLENVINWISVTGANDLCGLSPEMVVKICQIYHTNNFDSGLYQNMSRFNHSCHPNGHYFWDTATGTKELRAFMDIKKGEEITLTYMPFWTETREERRAILKEGYNFHCKCDACDITEEEVQKETWDCELFKEEEKKRNEFKGTREGMLQEASCLKRMYKLGREMKGMNRNHFLGEIVEGLFHVSCQAYASTSSFNPNEKARLIKDVNIFASTGLKMATKLFGDTEPGALLWRARKEDPVKYFRKKNGGL